MCHNQQHGPTIRASGIQQPFQEVNSIGVGIREMGVVGEDADRQPRMASRGLAYTAHDTGGFGLMLLLFNIAKGGES